MNLSNSLSARHKWRATRSPMLAERRNTMDMDKSRMESQMRDLESRFRRLEDENRRVATDKRNLEEEVSILKRKLREKDDEIAKLLNG